MAVYLLIKTVLYILVSDTWVWTYLGNKNVLHLLKSIITVAIKIK